MNKILKAFSNEKEHVYFHDIDRQLLQGFECSQFSMDNKKYLSMIKEQTNSAMDNKKYWNATWIDFQTKSSEWLKRQISFKTINFNNVDIMNNF